MRSAEEQMHDALASAALTTICSDKSEDDGVAAAMETLERMGVFTVVAQTGHMQFRAVTVHPEPFHSMVNQKLRRS